MQPPTKYEPAIKTEKVLSLEGLPAVFEREFDVGVRIGRLRDSSLIARKIGPIRLAVCAAPDYLARHGVPKTPDDLPRHDCLEYTYFESRGEWRLLKSSSRLGPLSREQCRFAAHNGDCGRRHHPAADFIIGDDLRAGKLVRLLPDYRPPEQGLHALYLPGRHLSAKVRSFADFLVARFGGEPVWDRA